MAVSRSPIQLIAGLGNPGPAYERTRHNAGFRFVEELAIRHGGDFRPETRFHGETCRIGVAGHDCRLLKPMGFMNHSGQAIGAVARFVKLEPQSILVVHDELDLDPGTARLKRGGGHGGHNGLRDTIQHIGKDFARLRLGIGHPGHKDKVTAYVLNRATRDEERAVHVAIDKAADQAPRLIAGDWDKAVRELHTAGE